MDKKRLESFGFLLNMSVVGVWLCDKVFWRKENKNLRYKKKNIFYFPLPFILSSLHNYLPFFTIVPQPFHLQLGAYVCKTAKITIYRSTIFVVLSRGT